MAYLLKNDSNLDLGILLVDVHLHLVREVLRCIASFLLGVLELLVENIGFGGVAIHSLRMVLLGFFMLLILVVFQDVSFFFHFINLSVQAWDDFRLQ